MPGLFQKMVSHTIILRSLMNDEYSIETLDPFGVILRRKGSNSSLDQFTRAQILEWVKKYKLVVFRGYDIFPKQELALFGQKIGKPLQWPFGAINELKVKKDTENYIFTDHAVPMHWDGAFAGKIPHIILFQCLVAPRKEDKGGTTFCDTTSILAHAKPEQLEEWRKVSVTYTTKKIVHYGGKITQSLLEKHKVDSTPVIRYAEPVDDLNPVTLNVHGLEGKTQDEFEKEMNQLLYHSENLYVHSWEENDIVLADNHSLLHGREAFKNPNERYIQRINILHRPERMSLSRFINNCLTIRRKEFFVAELPIFLIPLILALGTWNDFLQPALYIGLAAIFMLFNIGDMINCYADYKLDAIYKSHLSNAVYELGKRNVKWQIIGSGIISIILTVIVGVITKQYYLIPLTLVGTFIGLQYSVKPFKFKSRGIWQLFCLWGIIFFGPMLYTFIIAKGFPDVFQIILISFFGFMQMGIILLNTAEDYTEDINDGLNTIIVSLGLHRSMKLALWLVIISGLIIQISIGINLFLSKTEWYLFPAILIFTTGWIKVILEYKKIIKKINGQDVDEAVKTIKKNGMKVPQWLKTTAYTFTVTLIIIKILMYV